MKLPAVNPLWVFGAVAIVGTVGLIAWRARQAGGVGPLAASAGQAVGSAAVQAVDGAAKGVIETIGQVVGIPVTSETECERAKREGRTWDASFACPAGDFLGYVFTPSPPPIDESVMDRWDAKAKPAPQQAAPLGDPSGYTMFGDYFNPYTGAFELGS